MSDVDFFTSDINFFVSILDFSIPIINEAREVCCKIRPYLLDFLFVYPCGKQAN